MTMRFRLLPEGLEEAAFKRVPEGWLFTTPSPWIFAPRRTYVVDDAQKVALAARMRRARAIVLVAVVVMMVLMAAAFIQVPSLVRSPSLAGWAVLAACVLVFAAVVLGINHLAVRPLLRGLPRSTQKVSYADMIRTQGDAMSRKALAVFTGIFLFAVVSSMAQSLAAGGSLLSAIGALPMVLFAMVFAGMLAVKLLKGAAPAAAAEPTLESLAARLAQAEQANRRLGWSLAALAVLALLLAPFAVLTLLQSGALRLDLASVRAERIVLRTDDGAQAAVLSTGAAGEPSLLLYDARRKLRTNIGLSRDGAPHLVMNDARGNIRANVGLNNTDQPYFLLADSNDKVRASITLRRDQPAILLADAQGKLRAQLALDDQQQPVLRLTAPDGKPIWDATTPAPK